MPGSFELSGLKSGFRPGTIPLPSSFDRVQRLHSEPSSNFRRPQIRMSAQCEVLAAGGQNLDCSLWSMRYLVAHPNLNREES